MQCTCGRRFLAAASLAGKQVNCPACQRPLLVPAPAALQANDVLDWSSSGSLDPQSGPFAALPDNSTWKNASPAVSPRSYTPARKLPVKAIVIASGITVGLLVAVISGVAVWRTVSRFIGSGPQFANVPSSEESIQDARSKDEPITPQEMEAYYKLPANARDTTSLWVSALKGVADPQFRSEISKFSQSKSDSQDSNEWEEFPAARRFVEQHRASLQLAYRASEQGGAARYPSRFSDGVKMLVPEVQSALNLSRLLILESLVRAYEGDAQGAATAMVVEYSLAHSIGRFPDLTASYVSHTICESAAYALIRLLSNIGFSEEDLKKLSSAIDRLESENRFYPALLGERVLIFSGFANPPQAVRDAFESGYFENRPSDEKLESLESVFKLSGELDQAYFLHLISSALVASREDFPAVLASIDKIENQFKEAKAAGTMANARRPVTMMFFPDTKTAVDSFGKAKATLRITKTFVAIEQYRKTNHALPPNLAVLLPKYLSQLPADPFDGQPLRFRQHVDELVLYSIGPDRRDDGGADDQPQSPDIVYRFPILSDSERRDLIAVREKRSRIFKTPGTSTDPRSVQLLATLEGLWDHSTFRGNWTYQGGALISSEADVSSWKTFDRELPDEYQLKAEVEILSGEGSFNLAFIAGGRPVMLVLDGWDGEHSGLNLVNGQTGFENSTTHLGRVFRSGTRNEIILVVRSRSIDVAVNGTPVISWSGDPNELSLDRRFWPASTGKLYVGSWRTSFRLSRLDLTPLN